MSAVKAPVPLLLDPHLTPAAKLVWLCLGLEPRPTRLAARSGLARNTVLAGLAQLAATGWLTPAGTPKEQAQPQQAQPQPPEIPTDLLLDPHLQPNHKLLYATLQLTPGFRRPDGQFTYPRLSALAGLSPTTLRQAVGALQQAGWLHTTRQNQRSPIRFTLRHPVAERRREAVAKARRRLKKARHKGEALMREYLSLLVDCDEYDDDASPAFLVNPYTGEELQFDRYYPPSLAFEYQGAQHFGPTERFPDPEAAAKQQGRDLIKQGICLNRGIRLVHILPEDLTLQRMRQKVQALLPLRPLADSQPLITYLERYSEGYRRQAIKA
ncbi:MAG: ArsR family transcriptional regulator [Bacillota bacterium]